jgi:nucleotide-binding universal stress UspA family protein
VNTNWNGERRGLVVVGVDGSAGARHALQWAVAEARLRGSRLLIVHAWKVGYAGVPGGGYGSLGGPFDPFSGGGVSEMRRAAEERLEEVTAGLEAEAEGIEIERQVIEGGAPEVLVAAAVAADLLVVGSRGHGGFAGLLLGSVSQQCAHHAHCPVVIVHAPKPAAHRQNREEPSAAETINSPAR